MKSFSTMFPTFFLVTLLLLSFTIMGQKNVTFQVDMSEVDIGENPLVGIRGDVEPLSWYSSLKMTDTDQDKIYSVTINFPNGKMGDRILYKYMIDNKWDLDVFGQFGNRVITLSEYDEISYMDKWNELNEFAFESRLQSSINEEKSLWVNFLATGKKNGKSVEQSIRDYYKFWGDFDWVQSPQNLMYSEQLNQSKYADGYFEIIENTGEKVIFKLRKNGVTIIQSQGKDGKLKGISEADIHKVPKVFLELVCEVKGWDLQWKETDMDAIVIIKANKL